MNGCSIISLRKIFYATLCADDKEWHKVQNDLKQSWPKAKLISLVRVCNDFLERKFHEVKQKIGSSWQSVQKMWFGTPRNLNPLAVAKIGCEIMFHVMYAYLVQRCR